jgi:hypothetical protein
MLKNYNAEYFRREYDLDVAVIGGGVAGVTAAVAAARLGLKVGLMQNRPVYGGPSSYECNANEGSYLCVNGASDYYNRNARETGIIEEMKLEFYKKLELGWRRHWSLVLRDFIKREQNIVSFLNCEAYDILTENNKITQVKGCVSGSELKVVFKAKQFIDATGDSFIGAAAGAEFRMGREARSEFNESLAPEKTDKYTQGSTIMFKTVDTGKPVKFVPPEWAMKFESDDDLPFRSHRNLDYGYWWLECGGMQDTIADNEQIYDQLLAALFGVWDHIKNYGDHGAENYAIDWISPFVGKRESRRLIGDHILTQNDVMSNRQFDDIVAYGGWPVDIHPPEAIYGKSHPGSTPPMQFPKVYGIPFRCLYSKNIDNLMMPGRNISASHAAMGSTRVMATCATCAQAVATAASLCCKYNKSPREIASEHIRELQDLLLINDAALPGMKCSASNNLAQNARVSTSGSMYLEFPEPDSALSLLPEEKSTDDPCDLPPIDRTRAQIFPVSDSKIETITLRFDNNSSKPIATTLFLCAAESQYDFRGNNKLAESKGIVPPGKDVSVSFEFNIDIPAETSQLCFICEQVPNVVVKTSSYPMPGLFLKPDGCYFDNTNIWFDIKPKQKIFEPENAVNGILRASDWPNMWIGDPQNSLPQSFILEWNKESCFNCIDLIFDTNLNKINKYGAAPECIKAYELYADDKLLLKEENNYQRFKRHYLNNSISARKLELKILETNGDKSPRLYEIRVSKTAKSN